MKKYIVITSIFAPSAAVCKFAELNEYQLVVVGDLKSPKEWECENVIYLGVKEQKELGFPIHDQLPYNHYCRKMIGYLYAIQNGAEIIVDTDDDNLPYEDWSFPSFSGEFESIAKAQGFYNIYSDFTKQKIWPRGLPLSLINEQKDFSRSTGNYEIGIWQGLADGDPDVDAIYRLVDNTPCTFEKRAPIILEEGTICPFNSQNTAFRKEFFPLLYLPSFVTFRFTDILRGLVAQPILWKAGFNLGFAEATVFQARNAHNYLRDFESEIPMYLQTEKVVKITLECISENNSISANLLAAYKGLLIEGIVQQCEVDLLETWLKSF